MEERKEVRGLRHKRNVQLLACRHTHTSQTLLRCQQINAHASSVLLVEDSRVHSTQRLLLLASMLNAFITSFITQSLLHHLSIMPFLAKSFYLEGPSSPILHSLPAHTILSSASYMLSFIPQINANFFNNSIGTKISIMNIQALQWEYFTSN